MATSTNLANQVKLGPTLGQSQNVQFRGPVQAHCTRDDQCQIAHAHGVLLYTLRTKV